LNRKIPLHNNGTPIRNWLHAEDTAFAIITLIESGSKNEIYNICGGFEQSNMETVKDILKIYGIQNIDQHIDLSFNRNGQDIRYSLDDSKIKQLGWQPKKIFHQELSKIVNYYNNKFIW
jgi:dTDP-D-glucose 4,6-dehydratase